MNMDIVKGKWTQIKGDLKKASGKLTDDDIIKMEGDLTHAAGVIISDGNRLLVCHVTGGRHWDIPKGKVDPGESMFDAAVRELYEETSIIVADACLVDLGLYKYKKDKDLSLWLWQRDTMPDPATCSCKSTFNVKGRQIHEMDGYANVSWEDVDQYVVPDLARVLHLAKYHINNVSH